MVDSTKGEFGANNIPVALPLFDEEIFQKIPAVKTDAATPAGTTFRPGSALRPRLVLVETEQLSKPLAATLRTTARPAVGANRQKQQVVVERRHPAEPVEVYDYFAANQIQFLDAEDIDPENAVSWILEIYKKK